MSDEVQARIFEPFFTTKGDEGTGLGLDVCKRIIEAHDGTITFRSEPEAGTKFDVSLPQMPQP
jgi:signal transduction histidine kinase